MIDEFLKLLPQPHISLRIEHNEHRDSYMKPSQFFDALGIDAEDHGLPAEELAQCDAQDEMWTIQWYPRTPVGFCRVYGITLEAALRRCAEG